MISRKRWAQMHAMRKDGLSQRSIADQLRCHRRTVKQALASPDNPPSRHHQPRGIKLLDTHHAWLLARLEQYPKLTATVLFRNIQERGYTGGYTTVKEAVRDLRPRKDPELHHELSFIPGECAQADWGEWRAVTVNGGRRKLCFFAITLCHSRLSYVEFFTGTSIEYWLTAHRRAFEYFGGVPSYMMVDNCKTAVLITRQQDEEPVLNPAYQAFADHYGFAIHDCTPGRPNEKGRVENAVGYIKSSFLGGREPSLPAAINLAAQHWLETVANIRNHSTTGRRPREHFAEAEQAALRPLPVMPHPATSIVRTSASSTCRVKVDTNSYSVPPQYGARRLVLHRGTEGIELYTPEGVFVTSHVRVPDRWQSIVKPQDEELLRCFTKRSKDNREISKFLTLGSEACSYLGELREKSLSVQTEIRKINALAEIYGTAATSRAVSDAMASHAFASDYILSLLKARASLQQSAAALHVPRNADLLDLTIAPPDLTIYNMENFT